MIHKHNDSSVSKIIETVTFSDVKFREFNDLEFRKILVSMPEFRRAGTCSEKQIIVSAVIWHKRIYLTHVSGNLKILLFVRRNF